MILIHTSVALLLPVIVFMLWRVSRRALYAIGATSGYSINQPTIPDDTTISKIANDPEIRKIVCQARHAHQKAKKAQTRYQDAVSLAIGSVFSAFLVFSIEISFAHDNPAATKLAYTYETVLLCLSIILFLTSRKYLSGWMMHRAMAELHRQNYFVSCLFKASAQDDQLAPLAAPHDIDHILIEVSHTHRLAETVNKISCAIQEPLSSMRTNSDAQQLLMSWYCRNRIQRQIQWFERAIERHERFLHIREALILFVFSLAVISGGTKALYYWTGIIPRFDIWGPILTLVSQVTLASTAALAALLFSQNSQFLVQRYKKQRRAIEEIREELAKSTTGLTNSAIKIEKLMGDELVDFISQFEDFSPEISL